MSSTLHNTDFEVKSLDEGTTTSLPHDVHWLDYIKYLGVGVLFGIILVKSEVVSWFRIQEMFRFQSFHMYGVIGSAVLVGLISVQLIKRFGIKTIKGQEISFIEKPTSKGQIFGGLLFGFGWAMTGACPGPVYAIIGSGATVFIMVFLSALIGTWVYGWMHSRLPH